MSRRHSIAERLVLSSCLAGMSLSLGCFEPESTLCPTGITCPSGTKCAAAQAVCLIDDCGDGTLDEAAGEQCDDGNKLSGDGCSASCLKEGCGNGIVDIALGESCDDGNQVDGDGCSADCKTNERCGNGVIDSELGEVCDDGNNVSGDGCSADCLSEETCGNGYVDIALGEECEPTLPLSSALTGVVCGQNCKLASSMASQTTSDTPVPPVVVAKQCRLILNFSVSVMGGDGSEATVPGSLPGRIVSDKGNLSCKPSDGVTCVSEPVDCTEKVTLTFLTEKSDAASVEDVTARLDWGVEGCGRAEAVPESGAASGGQSHALWCEVQLSEENQERAIGISYDESRNQPPAPPPTCDLTVSIKEGRVLVSSGEVVDLKAPTASAKFAESEYVDLKFPGRIISDHGGIDCTADGGTCKATGLACDEKVTLRLLVPVDAEPQEIYNYWSQSIQDQISQYFSWNVEGCYPAYSDTPVEIPAAEAVAEEGPKGGTKADKVMRWEMVPITDCVITLKAGGGETEVKAAYDEVLDGFVQPCLTSATRCGFDSVDSCVADMGAKVEEQQPESPEVGEWGYSGDCKDVVGYALSCLIWEQGPSAACVSGTYLDALVDVSSSEEWASECMDVVYAARNCLVEKPAMDMVQVWEKDAVHNPDGFNVGKTPVTAAQFAKCVQAGACHEYNFVRYKATDGRVNDSNFCNMGRGDAFDDHPMNCVDWYGAFEFCEWMGYRLPENVDEWLYIASAALSEDGSYVALGTPYPWGEESPQHCVHASYQVYTENPVGSGAYASSFCNGAKESTSGLTGTSAVGSFPQGASPLGITDLSGNVWEWLDDLYTSYTEEGYVDSSTMVGGSWRSFVEMMSIPATQEASIESLASDVGFRCVYGDRYEPLK